MEYIISTNGIHIVKKKWKSIIISIHFPNMILRK